MTRNLIFALFCLAIISCLAAPVSLVTYADAQEAQREASTIPAELLPVGVVLIIVGGVIMYLVFFRRGVKQGLRKLSELDFTAGGVVVGYR